MPPTSLLEALAGEQQRDIAENPWYNAGQDTLNTKLPYMPYKGLGGALPILAQQIAGQFARNQGIKQIEETRQNRLSALSDALGAPPVYDPSAANPLVAYQQALMKYKQDAQDNLSNNPLTSPLAASLAGQGADNTVASGSAFNNALAMTGVKYAPYGSIFGGGGQGGNASQAPQATSSIAPSAGGPSDAGASAPGGQTASGPTLGSNIDGPTAVSLGQQLQEFAKNPGTLNFNGRGGAMDIVTGHTGAQSLPELEQKMAITKEGSAIQSQAATRAKTLLEIEQLASKPPSSLTPAQLDELGKLSAAAKQLNERVSSKDFAEVLKREKGNTMTVFGKEIPHPNKINDRYQIDNPFGMGADESTSFSTNTPEGRFLNNLNFVSSGAAKDVEGRVNPTNFKIFHANFLPNKFTTFQSFKENQYPAALELIRDRMKGILDSAKGMSGKDINQVDADKMTAGASSGSSSSAAAVKRPDPLGLF